MTLPNFLVIGAGKSGTTSLYNYLRQHPQIFMSPTKEPNFFALEGERPRFRGPQADERINRCSRMTTSSLRGIFAIARATSCRTTTNPGTLPG